MGVSLGACLIFMQQKIPLAGTKTTFFCKQRILQHSAQDLHLHQGGGPEDELEIVYTKEGGRFSGW